MNEASRLLGSLSTEITDVSSTWGQVWKDFKVAHAEHDFAFSGEKIKLKAADPSLSSVDRIDMVKDDKEIQGLFFKAIEKEAEFEQLKKTLNALQVRWETGRSYVASERLYDKQSGAGFSGS